MITIMLQKIKVNLASVFVDLPDDITESLTQMEIKSSIEEKCKLNVSPEERIQIELATRSQNMSSEWFAVRARRIMGSKCGKIINQKERTEALLISMLYSKPMNPYRLPPSIKWGIENEPSARIAYVEYMEANGHDHIETKPSGFIVHPTMGWLGASPDAFVLDPSGTLCNGIAEFKCPFTSKDISPSDACKDSSFYCTIINNRLHLKRDHLYYHQVQLQLFVCMDLCNWCDFCVYTLKGVAVERIFLDTEWCNTYIPELESYFDAYMLPEIVCGACKPSYYISYFYKL